jgi:acyl CoA:acetate/3-ketoacid CoA transferase beta subunit
MEHCAKDGRPKILRKCLLPLTAKGQVDLIITEKCVMEKRSEGLVLTELASEVTLSDVMESIDADEIQRMQTLTLFQPDEK